MCPTYVLSFVGHPIVMVGEVPDIFSAITELVSLEMLNYQLACEN